MSVLWWMAIGLAVGFLSKLFARQNSGPWWFDLVVGLVAGLCSGLLYATVANIGLTGFDPYSIAAAGVGSVSLFVYIHWSKPRGT
jgi:uncharacterized membrane protein YeaQ/YmgE (transglycosylase-associated protein family)